MKHRAKLGGKGKAQARPSPATKEGGLGIIGLPIGDEKACQKKGVNSPR